VRLAGQDRLRIDATGAELDQRLLLLRSVLKSLAGEAPRAEMPRGSARRGA
jgi:hypothetical protein